MIQQGDTAAIKTLWEQNKALVAQVARRYNTYIQRRSDVDFDDLTQAGYFGIHKASMKYQPERGMKFSSYAVDYIRTEMRIALGINTSKKDPAINAVPLDAPLQSDEANGTTLADMIAAPEPDENELELSELQSTVRAAVGRIDNSLSRHAIEEYYFNEKQMTQIAAEQEVSEQLSLLPLNTSSITAAS
jgi:RNA polymerase sigma factor (sigma-70 family)